MVNMRRFRRLAIVNIFLLITASLLLINYVNLQRNLISSYHKKCPKSLESLAENAIWQPQITKDGTWQIFSAYLDDREFNPPKKFFSVRILSMVEKFKPKPPHCQIFYANNTIIVKSQIYWIWKSTWGQPDTKTTFYQPYLMSCDTLDDRIPQSVSVVESDCDSPTNNLNILYKKISKKEDFVVCVKGLDFPDVDKSKRLVEWIEFNKLLGASKIHFYKFSVHPNVDKVLTYYQNHSYVETTPITLVNPQAAPHTYLHTHKYERRLQEVLPYTDCFYKNRPYYKYTVNIDIDEIILPSTGTWHDLMKQLHVRNGVTDSYVARNVYFFDQFETTPEIPQNFHIMRHVTRTKEFSPPGDFVKGFHDTERVLTTHNHMSVGCLGRRWWRRLFWWLEECDSVNIDLNLAQLNHYRGGCVEEVANCEELKRRRVLDMGVWRFRAELQRRVGEVLRELQMLG